MCIWGNWVSEWWCDGSRDGGKTWQEGTHRDLWWGLWGTAARASRNSRSSQEGATCSFRSLLPVRPILGACPLPRCRTLDLASPRIDSWVHHLPSRSVDSSQTFLSPVPSSVWPLLLRVGVRTNEVTHMKLSAHREPSGDVAASFSEDNGAGGQKHLHKHTHLNAVKNWNLT